ncbi:hypothetical protein BN133_1629 [Cronobacter dublinensis 582]|nr:hypothetical protein BN133_1629 [Cronobacter dublinensis 582]
MPQASGMAEVMKDAPAYEKPMGQISMSLISETRTDISSPAYAIPFTLKRNDE